MSRFVRLTAFAALTSFLSISIATAQQTLGSINGTVTDSSGAALGKASVKVNNAGTNLEVSAETEDDGPYLISALPIGKYSVKLGMIQHTIGSPRFLQRTLHLTF
jgi:hypothetical protein